MKSNFSISANLSPDLSHSAKLGTLDLDESILEQKFKAEILHKRIEALQVAPNLLASFRFAWAGVSYAFATQRNFRIHVSIGSLALGMSLYFHLSAMELAVVSLTVGAVLMMELLNTALEAVVDLTIGQTFHTLAKIAKDCAAAAVLIAAIAALMIAGTLLLPHVLALIP